MAFAGSMGAPAAMIPAIVIAGRGPTLQAVYSSGNKIGFPSADGAGVYRPINELVILPSTGPNAVLLAFIGQSIDGSTGDAGVLTTAVPTGNRHGIPTNFGPGRGAWLGEDLYRLRVSVERVQLAAYAAGDGHPFVVGIQLVGAAPSDVLIFFKNDSVADVSNMQICLKYDHTIVI